jgi:glycosyltransferase involved in cell wall biosynthesis
MGSKKSLAFIIPAYNEELLLPNTLNNLLQICSKLPSYKAEIIVVDNNSTDKTAEIAQSLNTRVIFEPINQISRARNAGAKAASHADYLFFIDADTTPSLDVISEALRLMESQRYCGGGTIVTFDSSKNNIFVKFWTTVSKLTQLAAGAFIFCTNEAYKGCGGYSESIYAAEDLVFSRALQKWGKSHGKQKFTIITKYPIITSDRKMKWFTNWEIFTKLFLLGLMPWKLRSRKNADFWYKRPESSKKPPSE